MEEKIKKILVIKADTNDGDYVTRDTVITESQIISLQPIIEALIHCEDDHNWQTGEYEDSDIYKQYEHTLTTEQIDWFDSLCPHGEHGVHTIESIRLLTVIGDKELLK